MTVLNWMKNGYKQWLKSPAIRYLEQATDHADLERRMTVVERQRMSF